MKITHGRHCTCSACAREDWTSSDLACCGTHGEDCPALYQPLGPAGTPLAREEPIEDAVSLADGATFRAIQAAISDPGSYCTRLTAWPPPLRQMEPTARWQTRAVMCALGKLAR